MSSRWKSLLRTCCSAIPIALVPPHLAAHVVLPQGDGDQDSEAAAALVEEAPAAGSYEDYRLRLERLSSEYPGTLEILEIGRSRGDRPILIAALGDRRNTRRDEQPGVFVYPDFLLDPARGAMQGMALLEELLGARSVESAAHLESRSIYLLPMPYPDRLPARDGAEAPARPGSGAWRSGAADPARDYPFLWDPSSPGAGAYPLQLPESRALAQWLVIRPNLGAAMVLGRDRLWTHTDRPQANEHALAGDDVWGWVSAAERELLRYYQVGQGQAGHKERAPQAGSLEAFLVGGLALFTVHGGVLPAGGLMRLLVHLPKLELRGLQVERLDTGLWLVEAQLSNSSSLATANSCALVRQVAGELRMSLRGARLVAAVERRSGETAVDEMLPASGESLALEHLGGGGETTLLLLIAAEEGAQVELQFTAPRGGRLERKIELR